MGQRRMREEEIGAPFPRQTETGVINEELARRHNDTESPGLVTLPFPTSHLAYLTQATETLMNLLKNHISALLPAQGLGPVLR